MAIINKYILFCLIICFGSCFALEPNEILVIANSEIPASERIAQYYCQKRDIPEDNLISWPLGKSLETSISRNDYDNKIAGPLREILTSQKFAGKIKCLLTIYGAPITVQGRGQLEGQEEQLKKLNELIGQGKKVLDELNAQTGSNAVEKERTQAKLAQLQMLTDIISGKETSAALDSELSMLLFGKYELYRWQINPFHMDLKINDPNVDLSVLRAKTLMVSRLDGPSEEIIKSLVDKAISAEKNGLKGIAYFDSRGILDHTQYGEYDQSLRDLGALTNSQTGLKIEQEQTDKLFEPNSCPDTALYCGWYSLRKYIDSFTFVDGAIGYHIASFEAVGLRDPNSSTWCPALLKHGITATLGPVAEPYLNSFPRPKEFFTELYKGYSLVEAYYRTNPFNSWMLILIGDPLYKPFKKDSGTAQ